LARAIIGADRLTPGEIFVQQKKVSDCPRKEAFDSEFAWHPKIAKRKVIVRKFSARKYHSAQLRKL
jgi:hypothetical protein